MLRNFFRKLFSNVGREIMGLAKATFVVGCIASLIYAIVLWNDRYVSYLGWVILIVGPASSWVTALAIYGLGQMIENTKENCETNKEILQYLKGEKAGAAETPEVKHAAASGTTSTYTAKQTVVSNTSSSLHSAASAGETWRCKKCGTTNDNTSMYCKDCGAYR